MQDPSADPVQLMQKHLHPYIIAISSQIFGKIKYYIDVEKRLFSVGLNQNLQSKQYLANDNNILFRSYFLASD